MEIYTEKISSCISVKCPSCEINSSLFTYYIFSLSLNDLGQILKFGNQTLVKSHSHKSHVLVSICVDHIWWLYVLVNISVYWQRAERTGRRILKTFSLHLLVFPLFLFPCSRSSRHSQPFSYWPRRGVSHTQTSKSARWQLSPALSGPKEREFNLCSGQEERGEDICPSALFCIPELRFNSKALLKCLANWLLCSNWPWWSGGHLISERCKWCELITWLIMLEPLPFPCVFSSSLCLKIISFLSSAVSLILGTIILFLRSSMCSCLWGVMSLLARVAPARLPDTTLPWRPCKPCATNLSLSGHHR